MRHHNFIGSGKIAIFSGILAIAGVSTLYSTSALAASNICSAVNGTNTSTNNFQTSGSATAGDSYSITVTNNDTSTRNVGIIYTDDGGSHFITSGGSSGEPLVANGGSKVFSFTASLTDSSVQLRVANAQTSDALAIQISCTPPTETTTSSNETTSKGVISSVSRSQTTVIQQNIGARVSAVTGSIGGSVGGATGGTSVNPAGAGSTTSGSSNTSAGGPTPESSSFTELDMSETENASDNQYALRRLAMIGDFDSSQGSMGILALGPTDQGDVGGAGGIDGRSALETSSPFTVWGHGSFTSVDNDYVSGTSDNRYDGDVWGYNVGLDYSVSEILTAGMSVGYNDTDLTTSFNSGTYKEQGWVVSPYAIYRPIANLNIVAEAGYGQGEIDVTRSNGSISGNTDSVLWYAAIRGSYRTKPIAELPFFAVTPSVGLIAARKTVDGYTESNATQVETTRSNTRQITPSLEASYDLHPTESLAITPFVEAGLVYDFTDEINNDKTAFDLGAGLRISDQATGLNAALEANYLAGRSKYNEYTIGGTVTYGFALHDDEGRNLGIIKPFFASNLNEYGNQRLRTGLGFDSGSFSSELVLTHIMSVANDDEDNDIDQSSVELTISMPF